MQALAYCSYNMKTVQEGARLKMHAYFALWTFQNITRHSLFLAQCVQVLMLNEENGWHQTLQLAHHEMPI